MSKPKERIWLPGMSSKVIVDDATLARLRADMSDEQFYALSQVARDRNMTFAEVASQYMLATGKQQIIETLDASSAAVSVNPERAALEEATRQAIAKAFGE